MSMFKDMLGSDESLFRDSVALDYDYIPKIVPFRKGEQEHIAACIKPLFSNRSGRNVVVFGPPGVGKTVAVKHLLKELEEETEDIIPMYINCWQKNTSFKIVMEMCHLLDYRFTHNKKTEELFRIVKDALNKKSVVFVFDEIDKTEDQDFLYYLLEEIYRKTIVLITNYKEWHVDLDERIKSRLTAEMKEFRPYNEHETTEIMRHRLQYAFAPGVWDDDAFLIAAKKAYEMNDIRTGLYILKEAGNAAEDVASKKIVRAHVEKAIRKLDEFSIKKKSELKDESQFMLDIIKENSGQKIGDLYRLYLDKGGEESYKSFQRKIKKLEEGKFIVIQKMTGGTTGTTSIITYQTTKKLTDF
ncbi:AAA family ATPase [Candidatus Woesearchaeota archaeon]|nr:AAA family ATPase [Candidatus Woesearchaeota archaeon]